MADDKRKKKGGMFGGYRTRQEQLDAQMEATGASQNQPKKSLRESQPTKPVKRPQKKESGPKKCPVWIRSADCAAKGYAPR